MPLPRRLGRFNRAVTNHITRPFASVLPGFAIVVHRGRRTGRVYRTPVNAFRHHDGLVIVLTYSSNADWVANVRAANGCTLVRLGRRVSVTRPVLVRGSGATRLYPTLLRPLLRAMRVDEAMVVTRAT